MDGTQFLVDVDTLEVCKLQEGPWDIVYEEVTGMAAIFSPDGTIQEVADLLSHEVFRVDETGELITRRKNRHDRPA